MSFDWFEYLSLAKYLSGKTEETYAQEAALRSAASRAYYAAFCCARYVAERRFGFDPTRKAEDHRLVREHFRQLRMREVAEALDKMCKWRGKCDYDEEVKNLHGIAISAIASAEYVFRALKKGR
ncbi:MAG: HEPN domain-containing protein [Candidatus Coatesbacteria bacterium]|nr:HEPN domain-containing protein [Candidatus Coatesbacteria bacterium]